MRWAGAGLVLLLFLTFYPVPVSSTIFSPTSVSTNVIKNPGFENGVDLALGLPVGWGNWTKHGPPDSTISADPTIMSSGNYSAKLDIGQTPIGFIALAQTLPSSLTFRNLTDSPSSLDMWFYYLPKYAGAGDVRIRVLFGENVGELDYIFDPDPRLSYPNSTATATVYNSTCTCYASLPSGAKNIFLYGYPEGQWHHISRNLRSDWAAPLKITNSSGTFFVRGFSLDVPFPRIQFDIMAFQDINTGDYFAETVWVDDISVYVDSEAQPNLPPVANFSTSSVCKGVGSSITFDASSSYDPDGTVASYQWNFGDGSQLLETDPFTNYTYAAFGIYRVTLTVSDSGVPPLDSSVAHDIGITNCLIVVTFGYSSSPSVGQPVTFNATVTGGVPPYSFSWSFGDGLTGAGTPILHTYSYGSLFVVMLTVTDSNGVQVSASQTVEVTPVCCFLDFTYDPLFPSPGQPVVFTATLVGDVPRLTFTWDFGDNSSTVGGVVVHIFPFAGDFQVRLTATDSVGTLLSADHIVTVHSTNLSPVANFTFSPVTPHARQLVSFDGSSSYDPDGNITSWEWSFGDIFCNLPPCFPEQTGPFVQHIYSGPANYTVTLTVTDNSGARTTTSQIIHVLPSFEHDVSVEAIQVSPTTAIQGQQVGILLGLGNRGVQNETVRLVVLWDSTVISDRTMVLRPRFNDPFGGIVFVQWETDSVPPGTHTISAKVYLDSDQDLSNNSLTDGTVTILPPPTITLTPSKGALGTKVVVTGSGFPIPEYVPTIQVFMSFDDQFLGFAFPRNGSFSFTFNVPHSEPGTHEVKAFDIYSLVNATADLQVMKVPDVAELALSVETGTIYFPGDTATIYMHATVDGAPVASEGFTLQLLIYKPDGTTLTLNTTLVEPGVYKANYQVPTSASIGTYAVVASASQTGSQSSSALASFEVKPSWIGQQGPRIAGATAAIAGIAAVSVAWRKGYFRRKSDGESDVSV